MPLQAVASSVPCGECGHGLPSGFPEGEEEDMSSEFNLNDPAVFAVMENSF